MLGFAGAIDAIFANPVIARDAVYREEGVGPGVPVRVIPTRPDEMTEFNTGRFVRDTLRLDVRVDDAPRLAAGDTFELNGELLEVQGAPWRDEQRLVWRCSASVTATF